jgi:hypothetical protein
MQRYRNLKPLQLGGGSVLKGFILSKLPSSKGIITGKGKAISLSECDNKVDA